MSMDEKGKVATGEIRKFLEEENENTRAEIRELKAKLQNAESETFKYKNAFKMLVAEISKK